MERERVDRENAQARFAERESAKRGRTTLSDPYRIGICEQFPSKGEPSLSHRLAKVVLHCPGDQPHGLEAGVAVGMSSLGGGAFGDCSQPHAASKIFVLADPNGYEDLGASRAITEGAGWLNSEYVPDPLQGSWYPRPEVRSQRIFQQHSDRNLCFHGAIFRRWSPVRQPRLERVKCCPSRTSAFDLDYDLNKVSADPGLKRQEADTVDGQVISQLQRMSMEDAAPPVNVEMEAEEARLRTFENWPASNTIQPPQLAHAGFFYTGHHDNVKCFHCDGELRNWEVGDDPWMEHAKWFPRCEYVLQMKGRDYVNRTQELHSHYMGSVFQGGSQQQAPSRQGVDQRSREARPAPSEGREAATQRRDLSAEEQLRQLKNERTCKVCLDREVSIVFIPCGHLVVCRDCAPNLRCCPICRALIRGSVRAFMS
ncbi:baculoviral IAP repeat-containing protein 7-like isoform X2 [Scyliorhinus canicula]|uniref:baculoviral IAP repeat-containing protein 7-like isoform X2 n=1 Tax=Scyliorhinus canicula TaxID=7830 RepID=UPI0018F396E8|nr:baculoviral IAP repeat-containing protein 7-like isoform X2 [Scyliorhinus canicula]